MINKSTAKTKFCFSVFLFWKRRKNKLTQYLQEISRSLVQKDFFSSPKQWHFDSNSLGLYFQKCPWKKQPIIITDCGERKDPGEMSTVRKDLRGREGAEVVQTTCITVCQ